MEAVECNLGKAITDDEFRDIRALVYDRFGINLTEQKRNLVVGRLGKILRQRGFSNFRQYLELLANDRSGEAASELINQISTNHTFFFRESEHFDFLTGVALPEIRAELEAKHERDLRIWSAGCSSGEEPYTITMVLKEFFGRDYASWKAGVLATDISANVLAKASTGIFPADRLAKTPQALVSKYFVRQDAENVRVADSIRGEVTFRRLNFMSPTFPFKRSFHIIFCRNVMIYFDAPTREELVRKFHGALAPGGYLLIGHSETLGRDNQLFDYVQPAVYRKR